MKKDLELVSFKKGMVCPTCCKRISVWERVEFNVKTKIVKHLSCADLDNLKNKKLKELENAKKMIK